MQYLSASNEFGLDCCYSCCLLSGKGKILYWTLGKVCVLFTYSYIRFEFPLCARNLPPSPSHLGLFSGFASRRATPGSNFSSKQQTLKRKLSNQIGLLGSVSAISTPQWYVVFPFLKAIAEARPTRWTLDAVICNKNNIITQSLRKLYGYVWSFNLHLQMRPT